ncbi:nucleotide-binding universal stress UspA family protein [Mycobacterium sp. BK086]|uniref:universal stress protein n=1 Tax=Mycobacterium sp. BK086 TaxID=2512165 RepID=UPI001060FAD2|nr:universal stress protein [Mycobacterium sp. BK086]TDO17360.1 nucleotide-binding universal stress UspA family protein [Mycobacterium sp. BK086]
MNDGAVPRPSVVVGIDGSRDALTAALWAIDEAVLRDIPLRLVYAIHPRPGATPEDAARDLAVADTAVRMALIAIESTDKPVKVEIEIMQGRPVDMLLEASRAAEMTCIGAIGIGTATGVRLGSTALALANNSHGPVAIIRGFDPVIRNKAVVVEIDASAESDVVLQRGIEEAQLRHAPLVAISTWRTEADSRNGAGAVAEQNRVLTAALTRRLARSGHSRPQRDVTPMAVHGSLPAYLAEHARTIQLVIVSRRRPHGIAELVGPPCSLALHGTDCSVLICEPMRPL